MDFPAFVIVVALIIVYIMVCNEVAKAAKENYLPAIWKYFFISLLFTPVMGILLVIARKGTISN